MDKKTYRYHLGTPYKEVVLNGFFTIIALVVMLIIIRRFFSSHSDTNEGKSTEDGSYQPGDGHGLYSDDPKMDRLYTDLDDTEYFEDMMDEMDD